MLMQDFGGLKAVGQEANRSIRLTSKSKNLSFLQNEYMAVFRGLLAERELESPFDSQDAVQIKSFFDEVSRRWKDRKAELNVSE